MMIHILVKSKDSVNLYENDGLVDNVKHIIVNGFYNVQFTFMSFLIV